MKFRHFASAALLFLFCVATSFLAGCDANSDVKEIYSTNIKKLHLCYMMYLENHEFVGPANEEELKNFLKNDPTAIFLLKRIDVTPEIIDDLFISDRDGEPFVIRYGVQRQADHAIIFEANGLDGTRLIAFTSPLEISDDDQYKKYLSGEIKPKYADDASGGMGEEEISDSATTADQ